MALEITKRRNIVMPLQALDRHPTRRRLACWMAENADQLYDPVIRFGADDGKRPLLVCIHPVSGHGSIFRRLARRLDTRFTVVALHARGLNPGETPLTSFAEMVDTYTNRLTAMDGAHDITLLGWSFGGQVAQAIGRELNRRDRPPRRLFVLDSYASEKAFLERPEPLPSYRDFLRERYSWLAPDRLSEVESMTEEELLRGLLDKLIARGAFSDAVHKLSFPSLARFAHVAHRLESMHRRHRPEPATIPTVLIQAADSADWGRDGVGQWRAISTDLSLERIEVPHLALMSRKESVSRLAEIVLEHSFR